MASHLASLWKWDFLELGNGLLTFQLIVGGTKRSKLKLVDSDTYSYNVQEGNIYVALTGSALYGPKETSVKLL